MTDQQPTAQAPGYRRAQPVRCPKLDGFTGVIDQILGEPAIIEDLHTIADLRDPDQIRRDSDAGATRWPRGGGQGWVDSTCRSRIRHQAAAGSWTMPRQWEIQRTWLNSARAAVRSPAKPNGV